MRGLFATAELLVKDCVELRVEAQLRRPYEHFLPIPRVSTRIRQNHDVTEIPNLSYEIQSGQTAARTADRSFTSQQSSVTGRTAHGPRQSQGSHAITVRRRLTLIQTGNEAATWNQLSSIITRGGADEMTYTVVRPFSTLLTRPVADSRTP